MGTHASGDPRMTATRTAVSKEARQSETDVLRVGFSVNLSADMPERIIETFRRQTAGCEIARLDLPPTELFRWVERDRFEVDVFIVWTPDPETSPRPVPGWVEIGASPRPRPAPSSRGTW